MIVNDVIYHMLWPKELLVTIINNYSNTIQKIGRRKTEPKVVVKVRNLLVFHLQRVYKLWIGWWIVTVKKVVEILNSPQFYIPRFVKTRETRHLAIIAMFITQFSLTTHWPKFGIRNSECISTRVGSQFCWTYKYCSSSLHLDQSCNASLTNSPIQKLGFIFIWNFGSCHALII